MLPSQSVVMAWLKRCLSVLEVAQCLACVEKAQLLWSVTALQAFTRGSRAALMWLSNRSVGRDSHVCSEVCIFWGNFLFSLWEKCRKMLGHFKVMEQSYSVECTQWHNSLEEHPNGIMCVCVSVCCTSVFLFRQHTLTCIECGDQALLWNRHEATLSLLNLHVLMPAALGTAETGLKWFLMWWTEAWLAELISVGVRTDTGGNWVM